MRKLKRFLYISDDTNMFASGNPEIHGRYKSEKLNFVTEILKSDNPEKFINIIEIVNGENLLPRRQTIFCCLSKALCYENLTHSMRHKLYATLLNVCKSDDDLFYFVKCYCAQDGKKVPSGLQKIIALYYSRKEPQVLAADVSKREGYYGWTHKDLIKLSHYKTDNQCE